MLATNVGIFIILIFLLKKSSIVNLKSNIENYFKLEEFIQSFNEWHEPDTLFQLKKTKKAQSIMTTLESISNNMHMINLP